MRSIVDIPDDLDFDAGVVAVEPNINGQHFVSAKPQASEYTEPCKKCGGKGYVTFGYVYTQQGKCFACKGEGYLKFKTSPEARAKARDQKRNAAATYQQRNLAAFEEEHADAWRWLQVNASTSTFASDLVSNIAKFGSLTERQMSAVLAAIQRDADRKAAAEKRQAEAPKVNTQALFESFERASASGLKKPRLHFGTFTVSKAPDNGNNPGALYVKDDGGTYLGKIFQGKFINSRDCTDSVRTEVIALVENPAEAARAYGLRTGNCCICNRELTNADSVGRGIGPICAEKFGF